MRLFYENVAPSFRPNVKLQILPRNAVGCTGLCTEGAGGCDGGSGGCGGVSHKSDDAASVTMLLLLCRLFHLPARLTMRPRAC